jgi:hypothetical protein
VLVSSAAHAADWPYVTGTEEGAPDVPIRPFGFLQLVGESNVLGDKVSGLTSPKLAKYNGQNASFNTMSDSSATWGGAIRRARAGVRGSAPGTDQRITYFATLELGRGVGLTRTSPATLADAAVTFSYIPGARLRVGQYKLPTMDETVEANPLASEFVNYTNVATQLVLENRVANGALSGNASGFRDTGAELFESFALSKNVELSYRAGVTNGRMFTVDDSNAKDFMGRLTAAWVFSGKRSDPHRQEASLFFWGMRGERKVDGGGTAQRNRSGMGVSLEKAPFRFRSEAVWASGMLTLTQNPPFAGEPAVVVPSARALGGYVFGHVDLGKYVTVKLRYDELRRQIGDDAAFRVFRTITPGVEVHPTPKVRFFVDYEKRWILAPDANDDATRIVDTVGDRVLVQASVFVP